MDTKRTIEYWFPSSKGMSAAPGHGIIWMPAPRQAKWIREDGEVLQVVNQSNHVTHDGRSNKRL